MGTVNPTQVSDGTSIDAADVNTPVNQLAATINGSIDSDNLASNAVTTAKIADGAVTAVKITDGAVTASKIDLSDMGTITLSSTTALTGSWANYGTNLSLDIPTGCTKVLILGQIRLSSTDNTLKDFFGRVQKDATTNSEVTSVTLTDNFHGATAALVDVMDVTSGGTHTFRMQAYRSAGTGTIASNSQVKIIPLANA